MNQLATNTKQVYDMKISKVEHGYSFVQEVFVHSQSCIQTYFFNESRLFGKIGYTLFYMYMYVLLLCIFGGHDYCTITHSTTLHAQPAKFVEASIKSNILSGITVRISCTVFTLIYKLYS